MDIKAVPLSKFFKNKEDMYKNIMIISQRARQIISDRYEDMLALTNIEDTDEIVEIEDQDFDKDKSIAIAMDELLNDELEYRMQGDEEEQESDI